MNGAENDSLPTLDDVARAADVSTATVSRCLNRSGKVTEETYDRVMRAVEQLGYTPNFSARALAAKRTYTIGAIIPTMENAMFAQGLQAFQEGVNEKGYTLLVSSTGYDPKREAEQIRTLVARGADGLLLIGYERDAETYKYLNARRIPFLLSWVHRPSEPYAAIGFDNHDSMAELATAVLQKGHRNIAIISGIQAGNDRVSDRVEGIRNALRAAGLDPDAAPVIETPHSVHHGAEAFETLIRSDPKPTAIMCINDVLAAGAMQRARALGIDVPGTVSITGFDDLEVARLLTPELTTVHVPHRHMGAVAAQELITMVEKKEPGRTHRLQSALRMRDSLGAPAGIS